MISLGLWSAAPGPLYQRLAEALHAAIEREIPVGATLPPERRLAELMHGGTAGVVGTGTLITHSRVSAKCRSVGFTGL
jgi:hypothetical protein